MALQAFTCDRCGAVRSLTSSHSMVECLECEGFAWADGRKKFFKTKVDWSPKFLRLPGSRKKGE